MSKVKHRTAYQSPEVIVNSVKGLRIALGSAGSSCCHTVVVTRTNCSHSYWQAPESTEESYTDSEVSQNDILLVGQTD